jgi:hypothetical protein
MNECLSLFIIKENIMSYSKKHKKNMKRKKRLDKKKKHENYHAQKKEAFSDLHHDYKYIAPSMIMVQNKGKEIIETNYWESQQAKNNFFHLTINAGAFRLLVPEKYEHLIQEFRTGEYCIISRGRFSNSSHPYIRYELLFEDHTKYPYGLWIDAEQVCPQPSKDDSGKKFTLSVWTKGCKKVLEMDAYFRVVDNVPHMKPLSKEFKNVK